MQNSVEKISKSGFRVRKRQYLKKKGEKVKNWKTRWFVLYDTRLFYYKTETDKNPLGVLHLDSCSVKPLVGEEGFSVTVKTSYTGDKCHTFREYQMLCKNDVETDSWIRAVRAASCYHLLGLLRQLTANGRMESRSYFDFMPVDTFENILGMLDPLSLAMASETCKAWRFVIANGDLWKRLTLAHFAPDEIKVVFEVHNVEGSFVSWQAVYRDLAISNRKVVDVDKQFEFDKVDGSQLRVLESMKQVPFVWDIGALYLKVVLEQLDNTIKQFEKHLEEATKASQEKKQVTNFILPGLARRASHKPSQLRRSLGALAEEGKKVEGQVDSIQEETAEEVEGDNGEEASGGGEGGDQGGSMEDSIGSMVAGFAETFERVSVKSLMSFFEFGTPLPAKEEEAKATVSASADADSEPLPMRRRSGITSNSAEPPVSPRARTEADSVTRRRTGVGTDLQRPTFEPRTSSRPTSTSISAASLPRKEFAERKSCRIMSTAFDAGLRPRLGSAAEGDDVDGFVEDILGFVEDGEDDDVNREKYENRWMLERLKRLLATQKRLREKCQARYRLYCENTESHSVEFKSSRDKKNDDLDFIACNCHKQLMQIITSDTEMLSVYEGITVGAFAAHTLGFQNGGLRQLLEEMALLQVKLDRLSATAVRDQMKLMVRIDDLAQQALRRQSMCFCQALTACVASFATKVDANIDNTVFFKQLEAIGYIVQVTSLLSTWDEEAGMLGDMDCAVKHLNTLVFSFGVLEEGGPQNFTLATHGRGYRLTLLLPNDKFSKLPQGLQRDGLVRVCALVFNVGINERQALANVLGKTRLQDEINQENLQMLKEYYQEFREWKQLELRERMELNNDQAKRLEIFLEQSFTSAHPDEAAVIKLASDAGLVLYNWPDFEWQSLLLLCRLDAEFQEIVGDYSDPLKRKDIVVLEKTSDFCRRLNSGRITVCKSAKDRTSMAVTQEQSRILHEHGVGKTEEDINRVANLMRTVGTRMENVKKNVGKGQYAFNELQMLFLPKKYRPPPLTYGWGVVS